MKKPSVRILSRVDSSRDSNSLKRRLSPFTTHICHAWLPIYLSLSRRLTTVNSHDKSPRF